jgi:hypothetical protein
MFKKATKKQSKLRMLLEGPSGSGKTYSALTMACGLGKRVAVIDTEKRSASLYASIFDFDVLDISAPYSPEKYIEAIKCAEESGYDVLVIDSITHEWSGEGGCLEIQSALGGKYADWSKVTPRHRHFIETILKSNMHIVATARTKTDYTIAEGNSKWKVEKVGTKTDQREGLDFEFTTVLRFNQNHMYQSSKDRTNLFKTEGFITEETAKILISWLDDGDDEIGNYLELIKDAKTIDDLKNVWVSVPSDIRSSLESVKNEVKNELLKGSIL